MSDSPAASGAPPSSVQALIDHYFSVCRDFEQEAAPRIVAFGQRLLSGDADERELCLGGRSGKAKQAEAGDEEPLPLLHDIDVLPLFEALGGLVSSTSFRMIDISYNRIEDSGAKAVAFFVQRSKTLVQLNVEGNDIGKVGALSLSEAIESHDTLRYLNISHNPIGDEGMTGMGRALRSNKALTEVHFGNTDMGTRALVEIADALRLNGLVKVANLNAPLLFSLQEETTVHLASMIKENSCIESLSLQKHGIQDQGAAWLSEALQSNATITHLDLSANQIGADGFAALSAVLQQPSCQLVRLSLGSNRLTDEAADALEAAISANHSLNWLDLTHASLGEEALCAIARGLGNNSTLLDLQLSGNKFGEASKRDFKLVLAHSNTLSDHKSLDFLPLIM